MLGLDTSQAWTTDLAFRHLQSGGHAESKRTAERLLQRLAFLPQLLDADSLQNEAGELAVATVLHQVLTRARAKRRLVLFAQLHVLPDGADCLHANDARGGRYWHPLPGAASALPVGAALAALQRCIGKDVLVLPHGRLVALLRSMPAPDGVDIDMLCHGAVDALAAPSPRPDDWPPMPRLQRLEACSIHLLREALAGSRAPVLLHSMGKDSAVLLHLARKAFYPAPLPMPLLHIDTGWSFRQLIAQRRQIARDGGLRLLVHANPQARAGDVNPFDHGANLYTRLTQTEALRQAIEMHRFDVVIGGARRDEAPARAGERVFSVRDRDQRWCAADQRPEAWSLYNTRSRDGASLRAFPLSDWGELDIWLYILQEGIAVSPLYFAQARPVVRRDDQLIMVDDARLPIQVGERIEKMQVRFRSLGCYPLTGAIESAATTVEQVVLELSASPMPERYGRRITDGEGADSLKQKKQEGYF